MTQRHDLLHKGTSTLFGDDSEAEILNFYLLKKFSSQCLLKNLINLMASQAKTVFSTNIFFWLRVHMVNVHICSKNHKNRVHQKKTFVLSNYLKKRNAPLSEKNAITQRHDLLHKGTSTLFGDDSEAEILNFYLQKKFSSQ